jgi:hypothetical protein
VAHLLSLLLDELSVAAWFGFHGAREASCLYPGVGMAILPDLSGLVSGTIFYLQVLPILDPR